MVAAMQSPLEHPTKAIGRASRNLRFFQLGVASEQVTGEFVYQMEEVCGFLGLAAGCGVAPGDMKVSGLAAAGCGKLLVLERTDNVAKIFLVDTAAATNIYGTGWDLAATTPAIEALADPATAAVTALGCGDSAPRDQRRVACYPPCLAALVERCPLVTACTVREEPDPTIGEARGETAGVATCFTSGEKMRTAVGLADGAEHHPVTASDGT